MRTSLRQPALQASIRSFSSNGTCATEAAARTAPIMGSNRRTILTTGAAATAIAAVPRALAQPGATSFYEKGAVRIHFEEAGSGFPLLLIPGGGLNSTISNFTRNSPFNPIE